MIGALPKHCAKCLNLNGCCFVVGKCPPKPLHFNCHCYTIDIPSITARAESPIEKFTKYIFAEGNSKKQLFELWGYDIMSFKYLQQEFIKQAKLAYSVGDYALDRLDDYGQRLNIEIEQKENISKMLKHEPKCFEFATHIFDTDDREKIIENIYKSLK